MKIVTLLFLLIFQNVLAASSLDSLKNIKPLKYAIKFNLMPALFIDPNYQFSYEKFISQNKSFQFTTGYGDNKIMGNKFLRVITLKAEYRKYYRPFNTKVGKYRAIELSYKNVIDPRLYFSKEIRDSLPSPNLKINVLALNFKFGRQFLDESGFPLVDVYFGLGLRGYYNVGSKFNYTEAPLRRGLPFFTRTTGFAVFPAPMFGISIGFGNARIIKPKKANL